MIDTGATTNGIMPEVAKSLGLTRSGRKQVFTAGGSVILPTHYFRFGFFLSDAAQAERPYVGEVLLGNGFLAAQNFDAIIGMDLLSKCDLHLSRSGECRLVLP